MNIAVRSPNWIGDCIMALPSIRYLKKQQPELNIFIICKQYLHDIFIHIPEISGIITISSEPGVKGMRLSAAQIKTHGFQQAILMTNSFSSALLLRMAGIKKLTGYAKDMRGFLLHNKLKFPDHSHTDNKINIEKEKHHIEFYMDLIHAFLEQPPGSIQTANAASFSSAPVITTQEQQELMEKLQRMGISRQRQWLGISPSAAYGSAKQWLPQRFAQLIRQAKEKWPEKECLCLGSEKEKEKINDILKIAGTGYNLAGALTLRESLTAISLCRAFISNDSGLMHAAASFSIPLIALFGPTRPDKTAPLNENAVVIHYPQQCAPCLHRHCPIENHPCMSAITVEEVLGHLTVFLEKSHNLPIDKK